MWIRQTYQRFVKLVRFLSRGGFYKEKLILNRFLLNLIFVWPQLTKLKLIENKFFFDGAISGVDLSNLDRSSFATTPAFEEACINFRWSRKYSSTSNDLIEKGWTRIEFVEPITQRYVEYFGSKFPETKCWNSQVPNTGTQESLPSNRYVYWSFELQDWQYKGFKEIINHPTLDSILRDRFGDIYYLYSVINLISFDSETSHSVQKFHRDHDDINSLVLFIYWTSPAGGGTEFIRGSHMKVNGLENPLIDKTQGPPGSAFLMDTSGIHRGGKPEGTPRYVSWLRFSDKPVNPASFYDGQINYVHEYSEMLNRQIK